MSEYWQHRLELARVESRALRELVAGGRPITDYVRTDPWKSWCAPTPDDRRFPMAPLIDVCLRMWRPPNIPPGTNAGGVQPIGPVNRTAKVLGVARETVYRLRRSALSVQQADEYAQRVGYHPAEIWPEWSGAVEAA